MEKFYLVCDESGAKGYSGNLEQYEGEIGVMAGFVVPDKIFSEVRSETNKVRDQYFNDGKLHITDLSPEQQEQLRNEVFAFVKNNNITCIYEAIHTEGFHGYSNFVSDMIKTAFKNKRSSIKISHRENLELLHSQLFLGVFGKAIALCSEAVGEEFYLRVITDNIDDSVVKTFTKEANAFLSYGSVSNEKVVKGFDSDIGQVVSGKTNASVINSDDALGDLTKIKFDILTEDSGLTLFADVIVNSINYHFKNREKNNVGKSLNDELAIKGHPLEKSMYGIWECSKSRYFADALYMHPKGKKIKD